MLLKEAATGNRQDQYITEDIFTADVTKKVFGGISIIMIHLWNTE